MSSRGRASEPATAPPAKSVGGFNVAHLLIAPTIGLTAAFLVMPYLNMVVMSFRTPSTRQVFAPGYTIANYFKVIFDPDFYYMGVLANTLVLGVTVAAICLVLGYPLAYHLARTPARYKGVLYALVLSPLLVGVVVRCYGWMVILGFNDGLINNLLRSVGLIESPLRLMNNTFGVTVGLVHIFLPFMVLPLLGAIQSINPALEEAAQSLGASRLTTMRRVVFPLSLPGVQAGTVLVFVLTISAYVTPILLGGFKVVIMPTLVVQQLIDAMLWPFGAALAFVLSVAGALSVYAYLKATSWFMRGIE